MIGDMVPLVASHLGLINIDAELAVKLSGATRRQMANNFIKVHSRLKNGLNEDEIVENYDLVLCPIIKHAQLSPESGSVS